MKMSIDNKKDNNESQQEFNRTLLQNILTEEDRKCDFTVLDFMRLKKIELSCLVEKIQKNIVL